MSEAGISPQLTLWMFDFDGTLSPIVADRTAAKLDPVCRDMLRQLVERRSFYCAVISSRQLSDLENRVDVPGIYLGGGSGLEWKLPDGRRKLPEADRIEKIRTIRELLIPEIMEWGSLPGLEIEDKQWSVAVHTRRATPQTQKQFCTLLDRWQELRSVRTFKGPAVVEIQLFPQVDKAFGVRAFCGLVGCPPAAGRLVYAGDDENDAVAMHLVRAAGGTVFTVGETAVVPGSEVVATPVELAERIRMIAWR